MTFFKDIAGAVFLSSFLVILLACLRNYDRVESPAPFAKDVLAVAFLGADPHAYPSPEGRRSPRDPGAAGPPVPDYALPPPEHGVELTEPQIRWCLMMETRMSVLFGFANTVEGHLQAADVLIDYLVPCSHKKYSGLQAVLASPDAAAFGISAVRDAVSRVRVLNPGLEWVMGTSEVFFPGGIGGAEVTAEVQHMLNSLGFGAGRADGRFTPETFDAVRRFQRAVGLPETGTPDAPTVSLLRCAIFMGKTSPVVFRPRT